MPIVGRSPAMQDIFRVLARLMQTDLTVMISGESGTGKELVARALHDYGKRKSGPFVAINMAAIPRDLIESELFGHEKGAFTGAAARSVGRFEQAEGGTLFLDEIGDMPMEAQTRLLRVLQQGEYTTVGGRTPIKTNVRIVAATNKDLRFAIQQGAFREDLFFRLNVVPIRLPPLARALGGHSRSRALVLPARRRRRPADEDDRAGGDGAHAALLLAGQCARTRKPHPAARRALSAGRHRRGADRGRTERRRLAIACPAPALQEDGRQRAQPPAAQTPGDGFDGAVERAVADLFRSFGGATPPVGLYHRVLHDLEAPLIAATLTLTRGNQIKAAEILGLNRNTLRKKIRDLNLRDMPTFR